MRVVSSRAVRITACVPFYPMATTRAEKPHARSLPSLPRRHIRHLRGMSWVSVPPGSIRPGSLPLSHFSVNPTRLEMATLIRKPQILTAQQFIFRPLHLRPLTVVVQDFQDGNGICNGDMPSKSEPSSSDQEPAFGCWYAIVPSEKTNTADLRIRMQHRAVNNDGCISVQPIKDAAAP